MKLLFALGIASTMAIAAASPAQARQGCGPGFHRGPMGHCRANRGRHAWIVGHYYPGRGYWYNNRWYHHRVRWHRGWRYR